MERGFSWGCGVQGIAPHGVWERVGGLKASERREHPKETRICQVAAVPRGRVRQRSRWRGGVVASQVSRGTERDSRVKTVEKSSVLVLFPWCERGRTQLREEKVYSSAGECDGTRTRERGRRGN